MRGSKVALIAALLTSCAQQAKNRTDPWVPPTAEVWRVAAETHHHAGIERARALVVELEGEFGEDSPRVAPILEAEARLLRELGDLEGAEKVWFRIAGIREADPLCEPVDRARAWEGLAEVWLKWVGMTPDWQDRVQKYGNDALAYLRRAQRLRAGQVWSLAFAHNLANQGRALAALKRYEEAIDVFDSALSTDALWQGRAPVERIRVLADLARTHHASGDHGAALATSREGLGVLSREYLAYPHPVTMTRVLCQVFEDELRELGGEDDGTLAKCALELGGE